ncbi:hypothetical protein L917_16585 [Phytophthora nicotianae]|uniref:Uncharacterized protein n=1 Tax=Phytophthora nicotianae TaxID=4792 RepID=W2I9T6_PHYNI|nr:hypothetical protein L916_16757 [Phytophthora nicotianae]ETL83473.1 hypothetical protein L917_16585 [Phytophthora nicotianae]ETM36682.1 hypothetical protein L914_16680 [Phytophthora nicotianae]
MCFFFHLLLHLGKPGRQSGGARAIKNEKLQVLDCRIPLQIEWSKRIKQPITTSSISLA